MPVMIPKKKDEFVITRLATSLESRRFDVEKDGDAERKLLEALEHSHRCTGNILITRPEDIYFDKNARIQGKYSITSGALSQLCSRLLPGLAQALSNLAGSALSDDALSVSQIHDPQLALRWLNDALKLRFSRLDAYSLVVDQEQKRVEGVVGRKYAFLPNLELYKRAKSFVSTVSRPAAFSEGALYGRRLMLRFKDRNPLFALDRYTGTSEPFYGGFHFANSETGDCSIKASAVVIRQWGNTKAISEFADGSKIAHVKGKAFETRFMDLLDRVSLKAAEINKYKACIQRLMQQKLCLGISEEHTEKHIKMIESQLLRAGLHSEFIQAVTTHMLYYGSYRSDQIDSSKNVLDVYANRTAYDLYNALTYKAKGLQIEEQEIAEQVAFKMLIGKIHIQ